MALKRGKAASFCRTVNQLSVHCVLCSIQCYYKMRTSTSFSCSYIVHLPQISDCRNKSMDCSDFRGIAISPVTSTVFQYCISEPYRRYFISSVNQFGFEKVSVAVTSVRTIVETFNKKGCMTHVPLLIYAQCMDLPNAFDKVNHCWNLRRVIDLFNYLA